MITNEKTRLLQISLEIKLGRRTFQDPMSYYYLLFPSYFLISLPVFLRNASNPSTIS